jgi:hypothetical protein
MVQRREELRFPLEVRNALVIKIEALGTDNAG